MADISEITIDSRRSAMNITSPGSAAVMPNRRRFERHRLSPMYSSVIARPADPSQPQLEGHIYDISEGGARIELDQPLTVGETVAVDLDLPGTDEPISAAGDVVWVNDDQDDPGPRRMAVRFRRFDSAADRLRLLVYLGERGLQAAA
jgi:Tfp pilus assembly protein PilZ